MFDSALQRRIQLTTSCADADAIPKVDGAGTVVERDGMRVQLMHNGIVVEEDCYYGAWMTEVIRRLRGHHEPQEEAAFHRVVERLREDAPTAPVMVELGSFWAYYSLWFAHALPGARLHLVEPDLANLEVGRRNLDLNGVEGRFVHAAVGLPDGAETELVCESDGAVRTVSLVGVDGLMDRQGIERVDLLLCDAQGAELAMLESASAALSARRIRFLVVSTHHASISGDPRIHERCLSMLDEHGAHIVVEHTVSESFSGDGLVVAAMDPRDSDLRVELSHARGADSLFGDLDKIAPPVLSICIPTHHGRCELLEQALDSIAPQVTSGVELVVSDNASRDGTGAMIERFRERAPHVALVYARNDRDVGLENILRVVERASGDWCWLFGSDDLMSPDGIAGVMRAIERYPNVSGIGLGKVNFNHDMSVSLGLDVPAFFPASANGETVFRGYETIERELTFQHAYLSTNVVRRSRWLAAVKRSGPDLVRRHPEWPQLVVLAEMARRDPAWAWVPDVLVKARSGRPYLAGAEDAEEVNLAGVHVALADGLHRTLPVIAAGRPELHDALLLKSCRVVASADIVRNIKLQDGQTLARDLQLLSSFRRAFGSVPEFRRRSLPELLVPAAAGRMRRRARRVGLPMYPLAPHQIAADVRATVRGTPRARATVDVRCVVTNRGDRALRRAEPNPVAIGFRWFDAATGATVLEGDRCQLERPLRPGASATFHAQVSAPWEPGDYVLSVSLVQELVTWFDEIDPACGARVPVSLG